MRSSCEGTKGMKMLVEIFQHLSAKNVVCQDFNKIIKLIGYRKKRVV